MDSRNQHTRLLKTLCLQTFLSDFDHVGTEFTFRTVFKRTYYSYICCGCAFEHEFVDYLDGNDSIREDLFNRILTSIETGECPHVKSASFERTSETNVSAIHIAAAAGCTKAFGQHYRGSGHVQSKIFNLTPLAIAAIKGRHELVGLFFDKFLGLFPPIPGGVRMTVAERSKHNQDVIKVKKVSLLEFCWNFGGNSS